MTLLKMVTPEMVKQFEYCETLPDQIFINFALETWLFLRRPLAASLRKNVTLPRTVPLSGPYGQC